ncbi:ketopantoate reductase family protein [Xenorhabdus nematophila]|uniref:2-dehydropantoate 2-reductase n=1 Tax=Xenorhabdus nematophila (strain ATCC 19061 / DSM 3370 / CCUG 14189 / LMG 1036 / NCIMB 9965 / AN6) TaxID=406817 RepID=D3VEV6_XENNA|nr:ketopantoate reductase C-terminal domain-containing protein [Xenorhabdus nematophila]CEE94631.1 putative 2-dehydropantoate 2-reductase [Xenorhabdus nematophila str. Anatoliense]CEF30409.1 putative 2-dehydropantoate 2-reductase [Xenorhabdus nematophila str. Websteri]AYA40297.1 ketopantoate reductase family protein [Xenorhabdus nematophila]KHD28768.1 2-dehydropantoate 2-reductase [Xenorhabdus nematophila]MBA0018967.1 ketopantoate reductase family protein [Xenorhabdus nematophila]
MLRIGIIGTGAVACYLAHQCKKQGCQVFLLSSRGIRNQSHPIHQIQLSDDTNHGQAAGEDFGSVIIDGHFTDYADFLAKDFDQLYVCSKTVSNRYICQQLSRYKHLLHSPVVIFQNGFATEQPFIDEMLGVTVIRGVLNFSVTLQGEQNLRLMFLKTSYLGCVEQTKWAETDISAVLDLLNQVEIPFECCGDIAHKAFAKNTLNAAASVCGLIRIGVQTAMRNISSRSVIQSIIDECTAIGEKTGYVKDSEHFRRQSTGYLLSIPDFDSSLVLDVINGRETEADTLLASFIELSQHVDIATPSLDFVYRYFDFYNTYITQSQAFTKIILVEGEA